MGILKGGPESVSIDMCMPYESEGKPDNIALLLQDSSVVKSSEFDEDGWTVNFKGGGVFFTMKQDNGDTLVHLESPATGVFVKNKDDVIMKMPDGKGKATITILKEGKTKIPLQTQTKNSNVTVSGKVERGYKGDNAKITMDF